MIGLVIFFLVFLLLTLRIYRRKGLTPSFLLYGLYTLSSATAVLLVVFFGYGDNVYVSDYNSGVLYLLFALLLYLYPFVDIGDNDIRSVSVPSKPLFRLLLIGLTVLSYFSIFYFSRIAISMLSVGVDNIAYYRNLVAQGSHPFVSDSIVNTIAGTAANFYVLQLLFFFLILLEKRRFTMGAFIVLLSSLSYPVFVLAYMGRDGVVFWLFSFLFFLFLFYRYLHGEILRTMKRIVGIIAIPFLLFFLIITVGRFVIGGSSDGILEPVLSYLGQGPINFAELYDTGLKTYGYGANMFPLFFSSNSDIAFVLNNNYDIKTWVFKTFISSIYLDFGCFLTLFMGLLLIFLYRFSYVKNRMEKHFSFSFLLIYSLFITVYSQGIFYFRQYNRAGNLFIVVMLLLALFTNFCSSRKISLKS